MHRFYRAVIYSSLQFKERQVYLISLLLNDYPLYYDQIIGQLKQEGLQVHHFTLLASYKTILNRLQRRGDGRNSWNACQLERCLKSLSDEKFAVHIDTEKKTIETIAEEIADYVGVTLKPPTWHPILRPLKRVIIQIRHIR